MSKTIYLSIPISLEELAETAMRMDHEDIFKLIKEIDSASADYELTKRLLITSLLRSQKKMLPIG